MARDGKGKKRSGKGKKRSGKGKKKPDTAEARAKKLSDEALECVRNQLAPVAGTPRLRVDIADSWRANRAVVRRTWGKVECAQAILSPEVLAALVATMERARAEVDVAQSAKKYFAPVHFADVQHMIGLLVHIGDVKSPSQSTTPQILAATPNRRIGRHRFQALLRLLRPTNSELAAICEALRASYQRVWTGEGGCAVDETLYEYQPSAKVREAQEKSGDPVPNFFMPNKPHKHGLIVYQLVCLSAQTSLPFVLDFEPVLQAGVTTARSALKAVAKRWPFPTRPHIATDSAFGSVEIARELLPHCFLTSSLRPEESSWAWGVLSRHLPQGSWCGGMLGDGVLLSVLRSQEERKEVVHRVVSTGFVAPTCPLPVLAAPTTSADKEFEESLWRMKVADLKLLCQAEGVRAKKNKASIIQHLVELRAPSVKHTGLSSQVLQLFKDHHANSTPPHHHFYSTHFNSIDRHDRLWYRARYNVAVHHWRTKLVVSMLESALVNAWALSCENERSDFVLFREEVAQWLMLRAE